MNRSKFKKNDPWALGGRRGGGVPRPPGLKGKAIGMYYRNLSLNNKKRQAHEIRYAMPPSVENRVIKNLENIGKIAKTLNISITSVKQEFQSSVKQELQSSVEQELQGSVKQELPSSVKQEFEVPKVTLDSPSNEKDSKLDMSIDSNDGFNTNTDSKVFKEPQPGSSSYPDFKSIKQEMKPEYSSVKLRSFKGQGDYKYGYEDIITGSFDEKLDENLSTEASNKLSEQNVQVISKKLMADYKDMLNKSAYKKMMTFRETLPTFKKRGMILDTINNNQVVVISGETGCGKSTQVPQLILDEAIKDMKGGEIHIMVTQPRRIAASSLAARVAAERGERLGYSVGYSVRLEKVECQPRGSIMFCTTGVLLAEVEVNQSLCSYSHIILDEVHERDCQVDLSMCVLKKLLQKRKDLKVILMSATIDAEALAAYFDPCATLHIEGLAFPVKDIYLEDVILMTNFKFPAPNASNSDRPPPRWKQYGKDRAAKEPKIKEKDIKYAAEMDQFLQGLINQRPELREIRQTLLNPKIEVFNPDLIVALLKEICKGPPGAILVFVPGIVDITKVLSTMRKDTAFPENLYEIYALHSKLPSLQQNKIFERPPGNVRKIIVATNIAETSITIDDVVYVIDSGLMKMKGLNVQDNVATLKSEWVSQANLRQRRGRAGRCQEGICYHLMTLYRASKLDERVLPELQRSDLLEVVLTIKKLRLGKAMDALSFMPSPPDETTINLAVKHLQQCGALDDRETLTPLGWHLARLPVHPSAGKLLILGSLFGCIDRAASVAAVWGFKDPFYLVIGKEKEADEAKRNLALGEPSDHVAISEAIIRWESYTYPGRNEFAYDSFLSGSTCELLSDMKKQLGDSLRQMGFLPNGDVKSNWENRNSGNFSLFKAIIAAALYPKVGTARWTPFNLRRCKQPRVKAYLPVEQCKVAIHPSSVMAVQSNPQLDSIKICDSPGAKWLVYWLKQMSTELFLLEVTLVHTLPILLFGELSNKVLEKSADGEDLCVVHLCGVRLVCKPRIMDILFQLRALLDQVLAAKVMVETNNRVKHSEFEEAVLNTVIELMTAEDERVVYMDDDESESDMSDRSASFHKPSHSNR